MSDRLFNHENLNQDIFVLEQEEGGAEGDHYFGSIGDATMKHVFGLQDSGRQLWEELITTRNGLVFRQEGNYMFSDKDPLGLRDKENLDGYREELREQYCQNALAGQYTDESKRPTLEQAKKKADRAIEQIDVYFDEEKARREELLNPEGELTNDALTEGELIPYHLWEKFPQMWKHVDIPSTPKDHLTFMGECKQQFYDSFPIGHIDSNLINQAITILNRPWSRDIDDGYAKWFSDWVDAQPFNKKYASKYLKQLAYELSNTKDPDESVHQCLNNIDRCWKVEFFNNAVDKSRSDVMLQVLLKKEREWAVSVKNGYNVYASIKSFGQTLFQTPELRAQMKRHHWARYRSIRNKYVPQVMVRNADINRAGVGTLSQVLNISREDAEIVWFNKPFDSLVQAYNKGYIKANSFADDENSGKIIEYVEQVSSRAIQELNANKMSELRSWLIQVQQQRKAGLELNQWRMVWSYYRILKTDFNNALNGQKERKTNG